MSAPSVLNPTGGQPEANKAELRREAVAINATEGLVLHPAHLRKLVAQLIANGTGQNLRTYLLAHADPTGETAVRNVMRGAR